MTETTRYTVGGTVQADGGLYIAREADRRLLELCRRGVFAYVLTTRQVGKSSLMINTAEGLAAEGIQSVIVDLTQLGTPSTSEQWYLGLLENVEEQLELRTDLHEWWRVHADLSHIQRLTTFLEQVVLTETPGQFVIFLDEIDSTLRLDFRDDFFAAIRYCYNARASKPALARVSFVLLGVATPAELIADPTRTPFNVGERVELDDFTAEQARPLAAGLRLPEPQSRQVLDWILAWTSGHPYLTVKLCAEIAGRDSFDVSRAGVEAVVRETFMVPQREDSNIHYVRHALTGRADLEQRDAVLYGYRDVIRTRGRPRVRDDAQSAVVANLKLSGAVAARGGYLVVRNLIYAYVFTLKWVNALLPFRRRLDRVPKGIKIAGALVTVLTLAVFGFASVAIVQTREVRSQTAVVESNRLYSHALRLLAEGNPEVGQALMIEASLAAETTDSLMGLRDILTYPRLHLSVQLPSTSPESVDWSKDGSRILLSFRLESKVGIWDAASGEELLSLAHEEEVIQALWNQDESRILTVSLDDTARVWNAASGEELLSLAHEEVTQALWNQDESRILTAGWDGTARVWDAASGEELLSLAHEEVTQALWNQNESRILTAGWDGTARVWDAASGEELLSLAHEEEVIQALWNQDESRILTVSLDDTARVWNATTGEELLALHKDGSKMTNAAWNRDESRILTYAATGDTLITDATSVQIWNAVTGEVVLALNQSSFSENPATWNKDGSRLLTVSSNGAQVWDSATGAQLLTLHSDSAIIQATWNHDESRILTAGWDGTARVWDATTGKELLITPYIGTRVNRAIWSQDESRILTLEGLPGFFSVMRVWHATVSGELFALDHVNHAVWVSANQDGSRILTRDGYPGTVRVWDATTGTEQLTLDDGLVKGNAQWNKDGSRIMTSGYYEQIQVWDATTGNKILGLAHTDNPFTGWATWNWDETRILTNDYDPTGLVRVWDAETGTKVLEINAGEWIGPASWSETSNHFLTASDSGVVRVWDATTGVNLITLPILEQLKQVSWGKDEGRILTISSPYANGTNPDDPGRTVGSSYLRVWDAKTGKVLLFIENGVNSASWDDSGERILTANRDGTVRVFDAMTGIELSRPFISSAPVTEAIWNADESQILGQGSSAISIWNVKTGQLRFELEYEDFVVDAGWSPDGSYIWVSHGSQVTFYYTRMEYLTTPACERIFRNMTRAEWVRYMGDTPYRPTCDGKPYQDENGQWVTASEP